MKAARVIDAIRSAGYHDDGAAAALLYVENRVRKADADAAWARGVAQRQKGVLCDCVPCKRNRERAAR